METSARTQRRSRRGRRRLTGTAVNVALAALLLGCAPGTPQAVLNVPGTYVANLLSPPLGYPNGLPYATVLMCLDEPSAVFLETGPGSGGWVGSIELEWSGTVYATSGTGGAVTLTTPVLEPGCGRLEFGVDCCHVDNYLAIQATKV